MLLNACESVGELQTPNYQGKCKWVPPFVGIWYYLFKLQMEMLCDLVLLLQIYLQIWAQARYRAQHCCDIPALGSPQGTAMEQGHRQVLRRMR